MGKRALGTVPVVATLAALFYMMSRKAGAIVPTMQGADDADSDDADMDGLGKFKIPKAKKVLRATVDPLAALKMARELARRNKTTGKLFNAATTIANPIKQVKMVKDEVRKGYRSKSGPAHWALVMSDPVYQQKLLKQKMSKKKKSGGKDSGEAAPAALTFPYEVEPGVWVDKDAKRVNQDGSAYTDAALVVTNDTPAPVAVDPGYDQASDSMAREASESYPIQESEVAAAQAEGAAAVRPYRDPETGLWYNPADDSYYNAETGQYYDGYMNPVTAGGQKAVKIRPVTATYAAGDGQDYPAEAEPEDDSVPNPVNDTTPYLDEDSGLIYDPASDTYFDPSANQYYDGYRNPIDADDESLRGLGALGKMRVHIAKGALLKTGAIVGAAAAVVGCVYATAGCAAFVGGEALLLKTAYAKSKPNPRDQIEAQKKAQAQYNAQHHQDVIANNQQLASSVGPASNDPYETDSGVWYDPKSDTYFNPATQEYFNPGTQEYTHVDAGEKLAEY